MCNQSSINYENHLNLNLGYRMIMCPMDQGAVENASTIVSNCNSWCRVVWDCAPA
ncbi:hypothetical protein BDZ91DRAFT_710926 [Kalaharituber pfeilii]|nr:hypothetical protein BDZ91DRAFT_710926 [Kalaharituber pfeilii]